MTSIPRLGRVLSLLAALVVASGIAGAQRVPRYRLDPLKLADRPLLAQGARETLAHLGAKLGLWIPRPVDQAARRLRGLATAALSLSQVYRDLHADPSRFTAKELQGRGLTRDFLERSSPLFRLVYQTVELADGLEAHLTRQHVALAPEAAQELARALVELRGALHGSDAFELSVEGTLIGPVHLVEPFHRFEGAKTALAWYARIASEE